jgi:ABC-type phosphate transport system substrate-binding protein
MLGVAAAGNAAADTNPGNTTTFAAVGSDTTQDAMEALSKVVLNGTTPLLSNYKSTPVGTKITTRTGNALCTFDRPASSGLGRDALSASMRSAAFGGSTNLAGCVDVARSSSGGNPATSPGVGTMTYIPFATDAVTYAVQGAGSVPKRLAKADLVAIYSANTPDCLFKPLLPSAGSGTRSFFLTQLGLLDVAIGAANGPGTCVKDTTPAGGPIQEHDGRFLGDPDNLVPISVAQAVAQGSDAISSQLGSAVMGAVDTSAVPDATLTGAQTPTVLRGNFPFVRPVYNVVPTAKLAEPAFGGVFSGATSKICAAGSTIERMGFAQRTDCGDTTKKNTN